MKTNKILHVFTKAFNVIVVLMMILNQFGWGATKAAAWDPNPRLEVWLTQDLIQARMWPDGHVVTLTIDDPGTTESPDYTTTRTMGPAPWPEQTEAVFDLNGIYHYKAGDLITVSDGAITKTHEVVNVNVTSIDANAGKISGTTDLGAEVQVEIYHHPGNNPVYRRDTADGSGAWSVDFSVAWEGQEPYELTPGVDGAAMRYDGDGDASRADWRVPNPYVEASARDNWVHAREWPLGTEVTLTIDGADGDYTTTATMAQNPRNLGDPNDLMADFDLQGYDIQVGDSLTVTVGAVSKTLIVTGLEITNVDVDTNVVTGAAAVDSDVEVWVCWDNGCSNSQQATANVSGVWTTDFSGIHDIVPGNRVDSSQGDEDGDRTYYGMDLPNPYVEASPEDDWVHAREWPLGTEVTLTIDGADGDYTTTATMAQASWNLGDPNDIVAEFDLQGYDVQAGDSLTATVGTESKTLVVSDLEVTGLDLVTNTVSGVATPGADVQVCVNIPNNCISRWVTADETTGDWSADYDGEFDLEAGSNGWAAEQDDDRDQTWADWNVPNPYVEASPEDDWVHAREWPLGTEVTLTIDGADGDYTTTATMAQASWNLGDPNDIVAEFDLQGYDVQAEDSITATVGAVSKTLIVSTLEVTGLDMDANTVSGVATPGADVQVCVNIPNNCISRWVTADETTGDWSADYDGEFDLEAGSNGWAAEQDDDRDQTWADWNTPNPNIEARTNVDNIQGWEWDLGVSVTLEIDDPDNGTGTDYTDTQTVGTVSWDSRTHVEFNFGGDYDLQPGDEVHLTDGATTKTLTVTNLEITEFDLDNDLVYGFAENGSQVQIWACWDNGCTNNQQETANDSGNWSTDFTGIYDIETDTWVDSGQWDEDGDATMFGQNAYEPNYEIIASPDFSADFDANQLHGYNWPLGASVNLTIDGVSKGSETVAGTAEHTTLLFDGATHGFTLAVGQEVTMNDGTTTETHTLTNYSKLSVGFIQQYGSSYWWVIGNTASFVDTAGQRGLPLKYYDGQSAQANQLWAFNQFIEDPDVNVIVLRAIQENGWNDVLQAAQAAGKVVILEDQSINAADTLYGTLVTLDLVEQGRKAGTEMCNLLAGSPDKKVVELVGSSSGAATDRAAGFREITDTCGITVDRSEVGAWSYDGGYQIMEDWLLADPDIQGVFAQNDQMGLGAIQAIKDSGLGLTAGDDIKIVSIDAELDAITSVIAGDMNATISTSPNLAPAVYDAALQVLDGQTVPKTIYTVENVYRCYQLTTSADPVAGGTVDVDISPNCAGDGYTLNTELQLTPNPAPGYAFTGWSGDASGTDNPLSITMNDDKTITANFEKRNTVADFDGDGDTDLSVYKVEPWGGMWYLKDQSAHAYGNSASTPVSCDYNGDGTIDVAVYNAGTWYVKDQFVDNWGDASSIPVPGDYDGDGACELAVYKVEPWGGMWYIQGMSAHAYGNSESIPVPADYNGDGVMDIAVYNAGTWYVKDQFVDNWGDVNSIPVPGDYNGDGAADLAVYKVEPWGGMWYLQGMSAHAYGNSESIPVPGDYNGDGMMDVAVYNAGTWYVKDQFVDNWGDATSFPLPVRDTNGDGDPYQ